MEVIHTNLSMHWMFYAYSLCTGTCVEVETKGLVVSVVFSSVLGEHLTWHKRHKIYIFLAEPARFYWNRAPSILESDFSFSPSHMVIITNRVYGLDLRKA